MGQKDKKLVRCLHAFIDLLPPGGRKSVARDVINCGNDDSRLFGVFDNLCIALLYPSKFNYSTYFDA